MPNNQTKKRNAIISAIVFLALMITLLTVYFLNAPKTMEGEKNYTLIVVDDLGVETEYQETTDAVYVGDALRALSETQAFTFDGSEGEFGFFLTEVNGLIADYDVNGAYWAFYLNDAYGSLGIDQQPLTEGDNIQLRYERGNQ